MEYFAFDIGNTLLDKVRCTLIGPSNGPVSSYVKSFTEECHMRPYMVSERRCIWNKTFLLGPIVWNNVISCFISPLFIMFLYK